MKSPCKITKPQFASLLHEVIREVMAEQKIVTEAPDDEKSSNPTVEKLLKLLQQYEQVYKSEVKVAPYGKKISAYVDKILYYLKIATKGLEAAIVQEHLASVCPADNLNEEATDDGLRKEFELWIKKAQPGLTADHIAYDIAFDAWQAGRMSGQKPPSEKDKARWDKEARGPSGQPISRGPGEHEKFLDATRSLKALKEASKGNYTQALRKVKALIDKSPHKANLRALIKDYKGEPYLEIRAYGLSMSIFHGPPGMQDDFYEILNSIVDDGWEVAEIDENETQGRQYKYALFTYFPKSDEKELENNPLKNMGRFSTTKLSKT